MPLFLAESSGIVAVSFDLHWSSDVLPRSRRVLMLGALSLLTTTLAILMAGSAFAQEARPAGNEFAIWFGGQFGDGHAFSETVNARLYELESRYSRLIIARGEIAVSYVAQVVPFTTVGDPHAQNGLRVYAHGIGGSPIGAQVNFVHYRRVEPFVTSSGGFLYFDRPMFGTAQQFNFTAQLGGGFQFFSSGHRAALDVGYKYHHISNANMDRRNPGLDSHMLFLGVSFFR